MKNFKSFILIISVLFILTSLTAFGAEKEPLIFIEKNYIDDNLEIKDGVGYKDKYIFLQIPLEEKTKNELVYNLLDGEETHLEFEEFPEKLVVKYWIKNKAGNKIDLSTRTFTKIDYEKTPPEWVTPEADKIPFEESSNKRILKLDVEGANISEHPGFTINVGGSELKLRWDRPEKKISVQTGNYFPGNIMPVKLFDANGNLKKEMYILKSLDGFKTTPTHYEKVELRDATPQHNLTGDEENKNINPFYEQNENDYYKRIETDEKYQNAGTRPGIKIQFNEPKQWSKTKWKYVAVSDFDEPSADTHDFKDVKAIFEIKDGVNGKGANSQFDFKLSGEDGFIDHASEEGNNAGVKYTVEAGVATSTAPATKVYTVNLVQDKSDLKDKDKFMEWKELEPSHTYKMTVEFEPPTNNRDKYRKYQLPFFAPSTEYAYTYLKYDVIRISENEGFLKIYPYFLKKGDIPETVDYTVLQDTKDTDEIDAVNNVWLTTRHSSVSEKDEIFIPIEFGSQDHTKSYQILMNYRNEVVKSQVVIYNTLKDTDYPVSTSRIREVKNLIVVPFEEEDVKDYPLMAKFNLIFNAPKNSGKYNELDKVFERLKANGSDEAIYYELYINDIPEERQNNKFEMIKVFKVTKNADDKYEINDVTPQASPAYIDHANPQQDGGISGYQKGYNAGNDLFKMNDIILSDNVRESDYGFVRVVKNPDDWDDVANLNEDHYSLGTNPAEIANDSINFLRIKAVSYVKNPDGTKLIRKESDSSMPYSISLSDSTMRVPIVDEFSYKPFYDSAKKGGSIELGVEINLERKKDYIEKMLLPVGKLLNANKGAVYRVFISGDKAKINESLEKPANSIKLEGKSSGTITDANGLGIPFIELKKEEAEALFAEDGNDKVFYIDLYAEEVKNINEFHIILRGLEQKRVVYLATKTIYNIEDKDTGANKEARYSKLSKTLEVTVPSDVENPDEEKLPLAPDNFTVDFSDKAKRNAKLNFFVPKGFKFKYGGVGFEILAVKGKQMSPVTQNDSIEGIVAKYPETIAEAITVSVDSNGELIFKRIKPDGTKEDIDKALFKKLVDEITIIDDNNTPNSLYYYYVRTISLDGENNNKILGRSNFISATLTTDNIKAPRDLKLNLEEEKYPSNEKSEIVVEFEAPVPRKEDIPDKYDFEIWVKMEDENYQKIPYVDGIRTVTATQMAVLESSYEGYNKFIYKISGLKSGKTYSIKLRLIDKANGKDVLPENMGTAYPKSAFSNILIARTEFDQADYDKEQKYNHYLDYFEKKARELLNKEYYTLDETKDAIEVYYKINYLYNMVDGKSLVLHSFDKEDTTYYLPSDYIEDIKNGNLEIELRSMGNSVYIKPAALKTAISDAQEDIREGYGNDYLIGFDLSSKKRTKDINGKQVNSEIVSVSYKNITYKWKMPQLEMELKSKFDDMILSQRTELAVKLDKEPYLDDKRFLDIALESVEDLEDDFVYEAYDIFDKSIDETYKYKKFDEDVTYSLSRNDDDIMSHMYEDKKGAYVQTDADFFSNKYSHDGKDTHKYVLIASDGDAISEDKNQTLSYYDLSDVFDENELKNPDASTKKAKFLKAIGNILGKTDKEVARSFSMGVSDMNSALTNEDAYYGFFKAYSEAKNIDIDNTQVQDYFIVEDIEDVNPKYKKYVLKGLNLGIVETDGYLRPKETSKMKVVLDLLMKLHKGVK